MRPNEESLDAKPPRLHVSDDISARDRESCAIALHHAAGIVVQANVTTDYQVTTCPMDAQLFDKNHSAK